MINNFSDILEYSANRFPENIAITDGNKALSYEELNLRVYSVARGFLDMGLKSGDRVVSLMPNCVENVIVHFAAAKIWCTLIPLGTDINLDELSWVLWQTKPKLLLVDESFESMIEKLQPDVLKKTKLIWVGKQDEGEVNFNDLIEKYSRLDITYPEGRKNKLCSIIYTSGTSGTRKGVMRSHENNLWTVISITIHRQYKPNEIELFVLPMSSVAFYTVFCPNLLCGSTVLIQNEVNKDRVMSEIERHSINRIYLLPFMWNAIISDSKFSEHDFTSLKQIMVGATPLSIETKRSIINAFPSAELYESWGMSEGGQLALEPSDNIRKMGSIGKPLCFNEMKIVDEHGYKVPPGMVGEITIRGKSVTKGYYQNPEETEKAFPNGDEWFYTGDLARYDDEGYFYLSGRKSEIIHSCENNIHPQEIEEALLLHPEITEAAVFGYPDEECGEVVAAAVTTQPGSDLSHKDVDKLLEKYIADYKKPKYVLFVDAIPKSSLGKINKRLLIRSTRQLIEKG
ncbi:MAG: acyl--CoA ligase [Clostridiales Family XIII bacterium]|jgi:acyl-CoA synthetase (AMP-forming)/AMP-acid ligase II|nr:acyl--CoA ligase [Clostridiales Family XIII bacterium]